MQQTIAAGLLDEIEIHLVPVVLGRGVRLFDNLDEHGIELVNTRVIEAPGVIHLRYRVARDGS